MTIAGGGGNGKLGNIANYVEVLHKKE